MPKPTHSPPIPSPVSLKPYNDQAPPTEDITNSYINDPEAVAEISDGLDSTFAQELELELEQEQHRNHAYTQHPSLLVSDNEDDDDDDEDDDDETTPFNRKYSQGAPKKPSFFQKLFKQTTSNPNTPSNLPKKPQPSYFTLPRKGQILLLVLCRLIEPLMYTSITPYLYYMIKSFGYTDPSTVSAIGTVVLSIFALGQALTGVFWGSLSDIYGRKPVLICGMFGTAMSTILFGCSLNVPMACAARFIAGVLNGNVGVMRTMIAEIVADHKEYQTRAFAVMPMTFNIGTIIGPVIGGLLADPAYNYPHSSWAQLKLFKDYPYLLPNLFPMPLFFVSMICCILFLEETLDGKRALLAKDKDWGLKAGVKVKAWVKRKWSGQQQPQVADDDALETNYTTEGPSEDELSSSEARFRRYQAVAVNDSYEDEDGSSSKGTNTPTTTEVGSRSNAQPVQEEQPQPQEQQQEEEEEEEILSIRDVLTKPVRVTITCYTMLMTHSPAFLQLLPLFMATPRFTPPDTDTVSNTISTLSRFVFTHSKSSNSTNLTNSTSSEPFLPMAKNLTVPLTNHEFLPFIFNGGLGMPSARIGTAMAIMGTTGILLQFMVYPPIAAWLGNARAHRTSLLLLPVAYALIPYMGLFTRHGYDPEKSSGEYDAGVDARWSTTFSIVPVAMLVILARTFAIPPMPVLVTNAAPSRRALGKIHGLTSSVTSVARCVGPFVLGNLYSIGIHVGMIGLAWWFMVAIVLAEIYVARELKEWGTEEVDDEERQRIKAERAQLVEDTDDE